MNVCERCGETYVGPWLEHICRRVEHHSGSGE